MNKVRVRVLAALSLSIFPLGAYAYVDPGSGMLIYQGLVAAIGVAIAIARNPLGAIKRAMSFIASKLRR